MSIIDEFLKQHPNVRLPSPPAIAISILDETNKTEPCFSRLGEIIGSDPGLTTRVLQIANSPIIAPLTPLDNLDKALARMGLTLATNIALSFALIENFRLKPTHNFDFDYFWRRALTAAASANIISTTTKHHNDNIFISSLLQDISILGVYIACAENHEKEQPHINKISSLVEDYTGYSHAHFSTEILEQWGVPKSITQPIRFHHQPESAPKNYKNQARIINLASKLSALLNNNHKVKKTEQLQSERTVRKKYHPNTARSQ
ncbi:MAG: hypothetical protein B6I36_05685 [Desulfobacteraceae bacterium 4572_35.1]|nr:MAG: hypothetical protein B6I36_05685 [Desulfobacteraceae bacterium 4572_35.1]